jgi:hypothetical protein
MRNCSSGKDLNAVINELDPKKLQAIKTSHQLYELAAYRSI